MGYGIDFCTGGSATASTVYLDDPTYGADKAFDDNDGTNWDGYPSYFPDPGAWIMYDLGAGITKVAAQYTIKIFSTNYPTEWIFQGSLLGVSWTDIDHPLSQSFTSDEKRTFNSFTNSAAYRYYRLFFIGYTSAEPAITEIEMMESDTLAIEVSIEETITSGDNVSSITSSPGWTEIQPVLDTNQYWVACNLNNSGTVMIATTETHSYRSEDGGSTWSLSEPGPYYDAGLGEYTANAFFGMACDSDCTVIALILYEIWLDLSVNSGVDWTVIKPS
jgi:hypothetical protein